MDKERRIWNYDEEFYLKKITTPKNAWPKRRRTAVECELLVEYDVS